MALLGMLGSFWSSGDCFLFFFFFLSSIQVEKLNSGRWRPKYQLGYKVNLENIVWICGENGLPDIGPRIADFPPQSWVALAMLRPTHAGPLSPSSQQYGVGGHSESEFLQTQNQMCFLLCTFPKLSHPLSGFDDHFFPMTPICISRLDFLSDMLLSISTWMFQSTATSHDSGQIHNLLPKFNVPGPHSLTLQLHPIFQPPWSTCTVYMHHVASCLQALPFGYFCPECSFILCLPCYTLLSRPTSSVISYRKPFWNPLGWIECSCSMSISSYLLLLYIAISSLIYLFMCLSPSLYLKLLEARNSILFIFISWDTSISIQRYLHTLILCLCI